MKESNTYLLGAVFTKGDNVFSTKEPKPSRKFLVISPISSAVYETIQKRKCFQKQNNRNKYTGPLCFDPMPNLDRTVCKSFPGCYQSNFKMADHWLSVPACDVMSDGRISLNYTTKCSINISLFKCHRPFHKIPVCKRQLLNEVHAGLASDQTWSLARPTCTSFLIASLR